MHRGRLERGGAGLGGIRALPMVVIVAVIVASPNQSASTT